MPQYVSLADQGFFVPYQLLGQGLARYQDRKDHKAERQQDVAFREGVHRDTMSQQKFENDRQGKLDAINMPIGQLNLQQLQEQEKMRQGMLHFNAAQVKAPKPVLPPGAQGPPEIGQIDLHTPFYDQTPQAQQAVIAAGQQAGLPPLDTIHLFGQHQAAMTGQMPAVRGPNGMVPYEAEVSGVKFHAPQPNLPKIDIQDIGDGRKLYWETQPDGTKKQITPTNVDPQKALSPQELQRISSLDQLTRNLESIESLFNGTPQHGGIPNSSTGPVMGRLSSLNPYNPDTAALNQMVELAIGNVFHGIQGQVGIMDKNEKAAARSLLPTITDAPPVRKAKLDRLRAEAAAAKASALNQFSAVGRDLGNLAVSPPASQAKQGQGLPKFQSEAEARAAGLKAAPGQPAALVFDPVTGRFRPWAP